MTVTYASRIDRATTFLVVWLLAVMEVLAIIVAVIGWVELVRFFRS